MKRAIGLNHTATCTSFNKKMWVDAGKRAAVRCEAVQTSVLSGLCGGTRLAPRRESIWGMKNVGDAGNEAGLPFYRWWTRRAADTPG